MRILTNILFYFSIAAIITLIIVILGEDEKRERVEAFLNLIIWILILIQSYTIIGR